MLTTEDPATTPMPAPQPPQRREPVRRVVAASVATGVIVSLALTLVVFGGATEAVVTGSALVAFAAGWAALWLGTARFTTHAQSWARVPALVLAFVGLALIATRPGDAALNGAGWVWPPLMLVLVVWIARKVRRSFDGAARWLLYPVVGALAVAALGAGFETTTRARDRSTYPAPGRLYDVGGHRLHLDCQGTGSPTVVLVSGLGTMSRGWARITEAVGPTSRVCAYDRAGQGWSDDAAAPQDGHAVADDLHALLAAAREPGPYVFVGHSAGGPYVMNLAARYPNDVAGVVLLDAMSPDEFSDLPGFATEQAMMRRGLAVLPGIARLGLARLLPTSLWSSLPEPAASQVRAFAASARGMRSMRDEQSMYPKVFEQAKALTSLGAAPLVVITATESVRKHREWDGLQDRLALLSTNHFRRTVAATHAGLVDDPTTFDESVRAIDTVLTSIRTGAPVAAR